MLKLIIYFVSVFVCIECAKILGVFPMPAISHQVVFRPLMHELARRGHEVTVITPDSAFPKGQALPNLTEIDLHDISHGFWTKFLAEQAQVQERDQTSGTKNVINAFFKVIEKQFKSNEVQEFIRNNKIIDLLFVESAALPALIFSHIYKAPVIEISTIGGIYNTYEMLGASTHPLIYPDPIHRRIYNLTLSEKISELYLCYLTRRELLDYVADTEIVKYIGSDVPSLNELRRNVHMVFLNVHPLWDFNRPVPPNVVYLGGLHLKPQRELPKDLKSYLDSSKHGVIYVSFGTSVKPSWFLPENIKMLNNVFSQLPYDVLWKWDNDQLPGRPKNVKISKWLPQSDLLRHPKIKLFITQGGLQSTDEAIAAAVPLIGIPMLGDQWFNTEHYVKHNIGIKLQMETMTEELLKDAVKTIVENESYRQNIIKLRDIMTDQHQSPLQRAVWWTEHVLRHGGGAHLRAPAAHMSWTEYYELELVLALFTCFVVFIIVVIVAIYFIDTYCKKL